MTTPQNTDLEIYPANGRNIHAVFTHFYFGEPGSQNITVTDTTFQELAPGSTATAIPVVWNIN